MRNPKLSLELAELFQVNRPDNVDQSQLLGIGCNNRKSNNAVAAQQGEHFDVLTLLAAPHTNYLRPAWRTQLSANLLDVRRRSPPG